MNRTVFITGGACGIGPGMARAFARAGTHVAVADVDIAEARATSDHLIEEGAQSIALDVNDRDAFARALDTAEDKLGLFE